MKNIAVLINSFAVEYSLEILSGISDFFEDKDVRLVISQTSVPKYSLGLYEYQNWVGKCLTSSKEIDAIIIVSGSYATQFPAEELPTILENLNDKPIISIGIDLNFPNCFYTKTETFSTYKNIIEHLKNKHNCKRIAFMSANSTKSQEALERFNSYKKALKENQMDFFEEDIFDGGFVSENAYSAIEEKFQKKEDVKFDAILCANDLMAFGTIDALKNLGLNVPDDIKVIGFDDIVIADYHSPRLSTINQEMFIQGVKGAELAWKKVNGIEIPKETKIPVSPIYRQTCGCVSMKSREDISFKQNGEIFYTRKNFQNRAIRDASYLNFLYQIENFGMLFDLVKNENTMQKLFYDMPYLMEKAEMDSLEVFLYTEPIHIDRKDDFILPESAKEVMFIDKVNGVKIYEPNIFISPKETLNLENNFHGKSGNFVVQPIYSGKNNYGFMVGHLLSKKFSAYTIYLKILNNVITQAYEYTHEVLKNEELIQKNERLGLQNKTDELTKILNRRGFMDLGQRSIDMALEMNSTGLIFFVDMDGLKKINDVYGHAMGDKAIKAMASVLAKSLRGNDVVGRLSGDEFAAVVTGMSITQEQLVRNKIEKFCKSETELKKFPFELSCSLGSVEFNKEHNSLKNLLKIADERLYIEKRKKYQKKIKG